MLAFFISANLTFSLPKVVQQHIKGVVKDNKHFKAHFIGFLAVKKMKIG